MTKSKDLVFYSWKPLSPEASRFSPYTHAQHHTRTSRTFCTFAVTRQPKPLKLPFRPTATPIRPSHRGKFVKASKGESSAPSTASTGPSSPIVTTSPKMEIKKRRKRKSAKCTVTSETLSPPEKKKKVILESQAEGPFYDTDIVSVPEDSPHAP